MPSKHLASVLVDAIRDTGLLPAADSVTTTAKLIALMNREQGVYLMRLLQSAREEYQSTSEDVAVVSGQTRYRLPSRATASAVKLVALVDTAGNELTLHPVERGQVEKERVYGAGGDYYFEGNCLVLIRAATEGSLRFVYARRFNTIVPAEEAAEISTIVGNVVTLAGSSVPEDFPTADTAYDFVQSAPQFDVLAVDQSATRSGQVLTFAAAPPADLAVGDYVALAGETPICNAPLELHGVLVLRAVLVHLVARGDARAQGAADLLKQERDDALALIQPRAKDTAHVVQNFNAPGWSNGRIRRRRLI